MSLFKTVPDKAARRDPKLDHSLHMLRGGNLSCRPVTYAHRRYAPNQAFRDRMREQREAARTVAVWLYSEADRLEGKARRADYFFSWYGQLGLLAISSCGASVISRVVDAHSRQVLLLSLAVIAVQVLACLVLQRRSHAARMRARAIDRDHRYALDLMRARTAALDRLKDLT